MKHNGFEIKVSDILNSKVTDTITFENRIIPELSNLSEEWVSWKITIQSLDHESLFVTLDVEGKLNDVCDRCWEEYQRSISIEGYTAKYVTQQDPTVKDDEDEILFIDVKLWIIDVEELIYHAIQLEEPFVKYCEKCAALPVEGNDEEEDEWH